MTTDTYAAMDDKYTEGGGYGTRLRPFAMHGINGIIPKVKANYFEVAMLTGGAANKDMCRDEVEYTAARQANTVRKTGALGVAIPHIGKLQVRDGICGVVFHGDLITACKGKTARNYKFTFTGNNWMNNKIYEPNRTNFGTSASNIKVDPKWF
jgi:hypothetical protein